MLCRKLTLLGILVTICLVPVLVGCGDNTSGITQPTPTPVEEPWEKQLHGLLESHEADLSPEERQILERYYLHLAEDQP